MIVTVIVIVIVIVIMSVTVIIIVTVIMIWNSTHNVSFPILSFRSSNSQLLKLGTPIKFPPCLGCQSLRNVQERKGKHTGCQIICLLS